MIQRIERPVVDFSLLNGNQRECGVSGFIRAKNEGEYIYAVIESWLDLVDEVVVVFNGCTDNTESEISRAILAFGDRVRAYHYIQKVYPPGSKEHISLPPDSVNSLVNYYNYALSMTTRKYAVKIDGDIIFDSSVSDLIKKYLEDECDDKYFSLYGVNLIDNKGELFLPSNSAFCGMNNDLCIFPVSPKNIFLHSPAFEVMNLSNMTKYGGCFAFYHMKFMKEDMGIGNYLLRDNPDSRYLKISKDFIIGLNFLKLQDVFSRYNIKLREPAELNIVVVNCRNYKIQYINKLSELGANISLYDLISCHFTRLKMKTFQSIRFLLKPIVRFFKK
ncbi:hypothetical protein F8538_05655 [Edwardsiella ictaluri]|uniref:hypothetical protein n=1 Tax=Edwardsiella ictaluri TaxID=67780 RepID=UPI0009C0709E|nr:hypothetical protein [Edwardsiella ictaluri]ARD40822.1 hypothetical protein B6E78_16875 [Edwardsiella ictaluri]QPW26382.1 hypothetical protein F8538_05655 [Edwardsiella ictaluri]